MCLSGYVEDLWRHRTAAIASPTRRAVTRRSATVVSAVVSVRQSGVYPTHSSDKWCEVYRLCSVPYNNNTT